MGLFDIFLGKKQPVDPEVEAAERRSYEKEREFVKREKKEQAIKAAGERGRQKARGIAPTKSSGIVGTASRFGSDIMKIGKYGASLNWGGETPIQRAPKTSKKKGRKQKQTYQDPISQFAPPEFPF